VLWASLPAHFRYVHEPLPFGEQAIPVLGHEELATELREHLIHSHGGTFLVTGFQGVGKSTMVHRALAETAAEWDGHNVLLVAQVNLARSMTADQLLFAIVRRVFEALDDQGLLALLPRDVRDSLLISYTRTSLSFTQTQSDSRQSSGTLGITAQQGPLAPLAPALGLSRSRTRTQATEAAFLAYSETDVEHDLVRIVQLLNGVIDRPDQRAGRRRTRRRKARRLWVHPVIVLDEIDKLTDGRPEAIEELEALIRRLKGVLTTRGAHFVLVAGPDLHDRVLHTANHGSGVYESVVSRHIYVPCLWDAPARLVHGLTEPPVDPVSRIKLDTLVRYLRFTARGVARRLLQEFNSFVRWEGGRACLSVERADWPRVDFYSRLEQVTQAAIATGDPVRLAPTQIDEDRWRMGGYLVVDWVLRSDGRPFAAIDVVDSLHAMLGLGAPGINRVLQRLTGANVLDVVREGGRSDATLYGSAQDAQLTYYKLADEYRRHLAGLRAQTAAPDVTGTRPAFSGASPWPSVPPTSASHGRQRPAPDQRTEPPAHGRPGQASVDLSVGVLADRYELLELIGQGGMGAVYRGRDLLTGQTVAVKMLHHARLNDAVAGARFRGEAEVTLQINHPNIVRTLGTLLDPETEPAIIRELVTGPSLADQLTEHGLLPPGRVVLLARQISQALDHIGDAGLARLDIKPSNVLLHPVRGAVIVDLGLLYATNETSPDESGSLIGTPAYMAPEQFTGHAPDIRADLFSLGLLMIHCLTGRPPWDGRSISELQYQRINSDVSVEGLPVSRQLRAVVSRATARRPDDRFPTPSAFQDALDATPEGCTEFGLIAVEESRTIVFPRRRRANPPD
jgi:serine/threonine-protein kinase